MRNHSESSGTVLYGGENKTIYTIPEFFLLSVKNDTVPQKSSRVMRGCVYFEIMAAWTRGEMVE